MLAKPPKKRVIILGDTKVTQKTHTIEADMYAFGVNDIHDMLVSITTQDVGVEMRAGNEPSAIEVDGSYNKTLKQAERKVVVLFSRGIELAALYALRALLISNIKSTTVERSGQLSDPSNWEFRLIRRGRSVQLPASGTLMMQQRDYIVLMPKMYYASSVNKRVASGSKSMNYRPARAKAGSKISKRNQRLGFMAMTARQARGMSAFATFSVIVSNTKRFAIPGERRRFGTAFLRIAPRRGTARR